MEEDQAKSPEHQAKRKKEKKEKKKNENETQMEKNESAGDVGDEETTPKPTVAKVPQLVKRRTLLVIGGKASIDWPEVFKGATLHAGLVDVTVEMASWEDIRMVSYSDCGCVVDIAPAGGSRKSTTPDFLLVRSALQGVFGQDYRNRLYAFMHSNVPSVNTLDSLYLCQNKPIVYGKLKAIQKVLGKDEFPLIEQACYADWKAMTFCSGFPIVAKLGTAHAGFGKMKLNSQSEFEDFQSVVALQDRYVTTEPFVDWDYDFRIQKIGDNYRAFRRFSTNWKGKGFSQKDEDIPVTPQYKRWIDLASKALGMDVCALDGVHSRDDGKEYILELNDSAIGLNARYEDEDLLHIRDLVLFRMTQAFPLPTNELTESQDADEVEDEDSIDALKEKIAKLQVKLDQVTGEKNALLAAQAEKTPSKKSGEKDKGHMFGFGWKKSDKH